MPKPILDADTILKRATPITGQHAHEIQPFGHLVRMPIALSEHACKESVDNLNQLLADTMTLRFVRSWPLHGADPSVASRPPSGVLSCEERIQRGLPTSGNGSLPGTVFSITGIHVHHAGIGVQLRQHPCSAWPRIGVQLRTESVFSFNQNRRSEWSGARSKPAPALQRLATRSPPQAPVTAVTTGDGSHGGPDDLVRLRGGVTVPLAARRAGIVTKGVRRGCGSRPRVSPSTPDEHPYRSSEREPRCGAWHRPAPDRHTG